MFQRMFGRRKSPVTGESTTDPELEEKSDDVECDDFLIVGDGTSHTTIYDPPPGYTVGGASAFLPYGLDPRKASASSTQRSGKDIEKFLSCLVFVWKSKICKFRSSECY
ncbi:uncharacterized protein [Panulirus ornatus]|uniref:uncharacterized protein isoform X2 n=1 Tax=Panulirus ornatus TaxID=150431 RepID=UPI003A86932E